jgi:hypothetical protein
MSSASASPNNRMIELFISYAHLNATWFDRLRPMLNFPGCNDQAYVWNDEQMKAGDRWDNEIRQALERMDVFVCLVSIQFLTSNYIRSVELKRALEREENQEIVIVPIVLYPNINLQEEEECAKLIDFNPLPTWGRSWREYERDDGDWQDANGLIRSGLKQAIETAKAK